MSAQFSKGDAVGVAFSGTVEANVGEGYLGVRLDDGLIHWVKEIHVEKREPEHEVFGPGDIVRELEYGSIRALGDEGYLKLRTGRFYRYAAVGLPSGHFTSESYERVDLS